MSKLPKVGGFKKLMHMTTGFGAAVVIIGALFKIMHWPGSAIMLILGLGTEAVIFAMSALDVPHEDIDWTIVYPELVGMGGHHEEEHIEDKGSVTEQLDNMLEQAKIGPELIESLGAGMKALSDNASKIADISNAHAATNEYVDSVKSAAKNVDTLSESYTKAAESLTTLSLSNDVSTSFGEQLGKVAKNLGALNASYELQLQGSNEQLKATSKFYDGLTDLMKNLHDSVEDTHRYKTEISALSTNLSALNTIYGNMLTAMNFNNRSNG
jgi:gliding motility-associated protein GldL